MALDNSRPQSALILCITANARGYLGAALSLGGQSAALRTARLLADAADGTAPDRRLRAEAQWLHGLLMLRHGVAEERLARLANDGAKVGRICLLAGQLAVALAKPTRQRAGVAPVRGGA